MLELITLLDIVIKRAIYFSPMVLIATKTVFLYYEFHIDGTVRNQLKLLLPKLKT